MNKNNINKLVIILLIILIVIVLGVLGYFLYQRFFGVLPAIPFIPVEKPKECIRQKIDGLCVPDGQEESKLFGVMIDNHSQARPQSGISKAALVYEAIAEGNITRYFAIFPLDQNIAKIGPIRSARQYYLSWAREFTLPYLHVGGSPGAMSELFRYEFNLDEMSRSQYFWRDKLRYAPHNVYTSTDLVKQAVDNNNWDLVEDFPSWKFKVDENGTKPDEVVTPVSSIKLDYKLPTFQIEWKYDPTVNNYIRYMVGKLYKDMDGSEVRAKNVAVMFMQSSVMDEKGRYAVTTLGSGKSVVFLDGKAIEGTWQRPNMTDRTRFYDSTGVEITFNAGNTWIEVMPVNYKLTY